MNLRQAQTSGAKQLAGNPELCPTAARDAELLLLHTLRISRATLLAHPELELPAAEQARYQRSLDRRLACEPIQYITGEQEIYGLTLRVTPAVLIPRPETEHLIEAVLKLLPANQPLQIADVGTGSGAIAIALAVHLPQAKITALDLSRDALVVATSNAAAHNVLNRVRLLHSDLLGAVCGDEAGSEFGSETRDGTLAFDAIVSNPPYVANSDRDALHTQVRNHEPASALFAGTTGLDIYRRLIPQAWNALKPHGLLALEIGHGQWSAVSNLLAAWDGVSFVEDLQQIPRVVLARRPAGLTKA